MCTCVIILVAPSFGYGAMFNLTAREARWRRTSAESVDGGVLCIMLAIRMSCTVSYLVPIRAPLFIHLIFLAPNLCETASVFRRKEQEFTPALERRSKLRKDAHARRRSGPNLAVADAASHLRCHVCEGAIFGDFCVCGEVCSYHEVTRKSSQEL